MGHDPHTSSHSFARLVVLYFSLNGLTSSSSRQSVISCSGVHSMGGFLLIREAAARVIENFMYW